MILELIKAAALLLALSLLQGFIARFWHNKPLVEKIISGGLFGCICVIGMMVPIEVGMGVIIDPRSVVISMAGLFGGPIVAAVTVGIAVGYRLFIGGGGVYVGVAVALASAGLGLAYRYGVQKGWAKVNISQLFMFGILVHIVVLLLFTQLPDEVIEKIMTTIAIPFILIFAPATALLGILLKDGENRLKTESALRQSEAKLSLHLQNTPLASITWDENFHCSQWNKAAENIFGYSAEEALGKHAMELVIPDQIKEEINKLYLTLLMQQDGSRNTNENKTKNGKIITCEWYNTPIKNNEGKPVGVASLCEDITARKQSEKLIWKQANYDALTGLANREMLTDRLQQEIKKAARSNHIVALLYLDLDQFKDVNDTLGHHIGDILLVEAARRLNSYVREVDTVARLGGDEFTIIMGDLDNANAVERVANDILKKLAEPFYLGDETAFISTSIGITFYPRDASEPSEMLKNADQAMYAAKKLGRNCFQYFTTSMQEDALSRMALIKDLRVALPNMQFQLYYQPIINLVTGNIYKAEALIRWHHPTRGVVSPLEFIPVAEESGLIIDIGDWVFREAAQQCARWRDASHSGFQVSVNTSPVQYMHVDFNVNAWLEYLHTLGLHGGAVAVEITEGLLMKTDSSITDILLSFRDAGIQVSLDDFGTGYSSLSYLKKLDIDYLKIDQLFVLNLKPNSEDLALCEAIIVMAHKLGLKVIAEGIETQQQRDLLSAAGCDYGQGYLFSKPVPASEFETLMHNN